MKVTVIGSGEAFDSGIGNNAFLLSGRGLPTILIDCGYQIPERLWQNGLHRRIDALYLTHTHADHAFGTIPLLSRYWLEGRREPFTVIGHSGTESYLRKLFDLGFPGMRARLSFPLEFLSVRPGQTTTYGALTLRTARSDHSVKNLSVRFEASERVGRGRKVRSVAFSGDGDWNRATANLYEGVDLLCHELYTLSRAIPGHVNLARLRELVEERAIERILVSHHARLERVRLARTVGRLRDGREWLLGAPGLSVAV